ncbi:ABC transporter substrate-binding protein [Microlunatus ginsengisoli]|uniref:Extracellular solute-binding protein n=1 Tax=Microlunatus ginsengisoli TaxID=363863 RepID=A0ABP7A2Y0_9ACTN
MRRSKIVALGLMAVLLPASACGGGSQPDNSEPATFDTSPSGELKAWGFDNADDVGKARLDYAKSKLGQVTISLDATGFDAQKFTTRLASGDVPDVVQMDRQFVATYAAQDLIMPVDACFSAWKMDPKTQFYPAVTADVSYQDKIWAVPQFFQPAAVMLNQRVLDAEGVQPSEIDTSKPDELIATAKKLSTADGGKPTRLGFDAVPTGQGPLWLLSYGGRLVDDQGKPALDDPNNAKAIAFLKKLADAQGGYAKVKSFSDSFDFFGKNNQFVSDQVAAQVDAQWYVNVLSPYVKQVKLGAVPFKDQNGQPFAVTGGSAFVIPVKAKNPDAACAWMINLVTDEAWMAAADARAATLKKTPGAINTGLFTGSPSADKAIKEKYVTGSGNAGFDQTIQTFYEVVGNGKSLGASPAGQTIQSELNNAIVAALLGQKTPEQALADAQAAAMRAYDKIAG